MPEKMSLNEVIEILRFDLSEFKEYIALDNKEWWQSDEQYEKICY